MSQLVKRKRQANFKGFKRFRVLKWPTRAKKGPIYTQTRQINYYFQILISRNKRFIAL
jgi:hypothetical protein